VLTALGDGRYRVSGPDGKVLATGDVGRVVTGGQGDLQLEVQVTELVARPGTEMTLKKIRRADAVSRFQKELLVQEKGKGSGVLSISLRGDDPDRVAGAVNRLVATLLQRKAERASAENAKVLTFLESQLPALRANVEKAENALEAFRKQNGTVDLSLETRAAVDRSVETERAIAELEAQRDLLLKRYTERHPDVAPLTRRIESLQGQRTTADTRIRTLPTTELAAARLTRDVRVSTELYMLLLERTQQVRILAASTTENVRLLDSATAPPLPIGVPASTVLVVAVILGLGVGAASVLILERLEGAGDPADVEAGTGIPVLATVPHSDAEASLGRKLRRHGGTRPAALTAVDPGDLAVEDLRQVRTALEGELRGARNNVVSISGLAPGVGKSFVCANVAHLLAASKRRVLVIDADLRRGSLHRQFGLPREPGLADVLGGSSPLDGAVQRTGTTHLDVLAAGRLPLDPSALLDSPAFRDLLAGMSHKYDVVLVDTPAILAVTDAALVARHAGVNLLVLRAGQHPLHEIVLAIQRLGRSGGHVSGAILNDVRATGRYGKYGRYRRYEYRKSA
jgi:tyrosine-protein kinase Etk/Wzc